MGTYEFSFLGAEVHGPFWLVAAVVIFTVVSGIAGGVLVWAHAPVVGGEWWPYIRFGAAILGAIITGWLASALSAIAVIVGVAVST